MAAYFTDTKYFVNLIENSGLYGYVGLLKLLDWIGRADEAENPKMRDIIQIKAWGVTVETSTTRLIDVCCRHVRHCVVAL